MTYRIARLKTTYGRLHSASANGHTYRSKLRDAASTYTTRITSNGPKYLTAQPNTSQRIMRDTDSYSASAGSDRQTQRLKPAPFVKPPIPTQEPTALVVTQHEPRFPSRRNYKFCRLKNNKRNSTYTTTARTTSFVQHSDTANNCGRNGGKYERQ
jgi:hypothetical protein